MLYIHTYMHISSAQGEAALGAEQNERGPISLPRLSLLRLC